MPSQRRLRLLFLATLTFLVVTLWYTADLRAARQVDFYHQTTKKMQEKDSDNVDVGKRLKDAEAAAKKAADAKGPKVDVVLGDDAAGSVAKPKADADSSHDTFDVEAEVKTIMKKAPIIIFSKSYCPYSKKAKDILLDKYKIVPAPFVFELDQHDHGSEIQDELLKTTNRRTVPNILINGRSIGGGDQVAELDEAGKLASKLKSLGGTKIVEVALRPLTAPKMNRRR